MFALALTAVPGKAQDEVPGSTSVEISANHLGFQDGRQTGRLDGEDYGRSQAILSAWLKAYAEGLAAPVDPAALVAPGDAGTADGTHDGEAAARDAARSSGEAQVRTAFASGSASPRFVPSAPGDAALPADRHEPACAPPEPIRLDLDHGRAVTLNPATQDTRPPPLPLEVPEPKLPPESDLHAMARKHGAESGTDVEFWVVAYQRAYKASYVQVYIETRDEASSLAGAAAAGQGHAAGAAEALRRASCTRYRKGYASAFRSAARAAWATSEKDGFDAALARFTHEPLVVAEDTELSDANADGVIEPGEALFIEATLRVAGPVGTTDEGATFVGRAGVVGAGSMGSAMAAGTRRTERAMVGRVDSGAPIGSPVTVALTPAGGVATLVTGTVGRPVIVRDIAAAPTSRDGTAQCLLHVTLACASRRGCKLPLTLRVDGGGEAPVAPMQSGETRVVDVAGTLDPTAAIDGGTTGTVALVTSDGTEWSRSTFTVHADVAGAVALCAGLTAPDAACAALATRLEREVASASSDASLYDKDPGRTELGTYAAALAAAPAGARATLAAKVTAPVLDRSSGSDVPRAVRKAVRSLLARAGS